MKIVVFLTAFYFSVIGFAIEVNYKLSMPMPQNHYFHMEMDVKDAQQELIEVKMPVWAPGSYLVREFSKSVNLVKAFDSNGKSLKVKKTDKNTWKITNPSKSDVKVKYEVYAYELTVRTSFLDDSHGYINGTSVFMYVKGAKDAKGVLQIEMPQNFSRVSTMLKDEGDFKFSYNDYDHLVDCPIEIGNQKEFTFNAAGVKHRVAMYGVANYDVDQLKTDMAKIVESATNVFGENPNEEYLFIIHNLTDGGGGLEHKNSTTLQVNRWTYQGSAYIGFLSLVAHEYFHLWNVKRLRPKELGPFDYDSENYTSLLWVMEGVTSYYDELLLRRAGFYTEEQYVNKLFGSIGYIENQEGFNVQPVAHASFDAWIKSYRPNENSSNTTISYYSKGSVAAAIMDMILIDKSNGKKGLDQFMKYMYDKFYKKEKRGFTEEEFQTEFESYLGKTVPEFFDDYINGTKHIDYAKYFNYVGLDLTDIGGEVSNVGLRIKSSGGKAIVSRVRANSAGEIYGVNVGDEIIGLNGFRISSSELRDALAVFEKGDEFELLIARDNIIRSLEVKVTSRHQYRFKSTNKTDTKSIKKREYWLRQD